MTIAGGNADGVVAGTVGAGGVRGVSTTRVVVAASGGSGVASGRRVVADAVGVATDVAGPPP